MKGIVFKDVELRATIEGRQTQMRRLIDTSSIRVGNLELDEKNRLQAWNDDNNRPIHLSPRFTIGEKAFLKEPFLYANCKYDNVNERRVVYKFSPDEYPNTYKKVYAWAPEQFMDVWKARFIIEIVGIKCERLQDISDIDLVKEGIRQYRRIFGKALYYFNEGRYVCDYYLSPIAAFKAKIKEIHEPAVWKLNPPVWVYEYKLLDKYMKEWRRPTML